ncbi:flagellar basal body rod protein FlgB [Bacillaceae bacterium S4-13-58]
MSFFGDTIQNLERSLDYASAKNKVISQNIANIDTPGYKAKSVEFKNVLESTLDAKRTNPKHIPFQNDNLVPYRIKEQQTTAYNHNGNNVDIDKEMTELAKNQIYYQALVDRINGKFNSLETVLKGGR